MSIEKTISIGLAGNQISKTITGTNEVSAGRSVVATSAGAALGAVASGSVVVGASAIGATGLAAVAAPVVVPLAVGCAVVSFIASLFDSD